MAFKIEQTVRLQAPVERVWCYLIDPRQVVECLPGAELVEAQDDRTFLGKVRVKVGPITAAYAGRAQLIEVNASEHVVRMTAEGKETAGPGSAKMTMTSRVVALPTGGCEVRVDAELDLAGKIVQFGRGMIENVNAQIFKQFSECMRARLESPDVALISPMPAPAPAAADATRVALPAEPASTAAPPTRTTAPVRIVPLLLRAFWASIAKLFGQGRSPS